MLLHNTMIKPTVHATVADKQEITSPCTLVAGYCGSDSACTVDTSAQFGITCLRKNVTNDSSVEPKVLYVYHQNGGINKDTYQKKPQSVLF
jgi:hypothetical protein